MQAATVLLEPPLPVNAIPPIRGVHRTTNTRAAAGGIHRLEHLHVHILPGLVLYFLIFVNACPAVAWPFSGFSRMAAVKIIKWKLYDLYLYTTQHSAVCPIHIFVTLANIIYSFSILDFCLHLFLDWLLGESSVFLNSAHPSRWWNPCLHSCISEIQ